MHGNDAVIRSLIIISNHVIIEGRSLSELSQKAHLQFRLRNSRNELSVSAQKSNNGDYRGKDKSNRTLHLR